MVQHSITGPINIQFSDYIFISLFLTILIFNTSTKSDIIPVFRFTKKHSKIKKNATGNPFARFFFQLRYIYSSITNCMLRKTLRYFKNILFYSLSQQLLFFSQVWTILTRVGSWDSPFTYQTQQTKRTEFCVLRTPTTPEPRYLILSTSRVLITGDTSSTTTIELILHSLMGILISHRHIYVKQRSTVRCAILHDVNMIVTHRNKY